MEETVQTSCEELIRGAIRNAEAGSLDAAAGALKEAVRMDPGNPNALYHLALIQTRMGDVESAITSFRNAGDREPADPNIAHNLGVLYLKQNDTERAGEAFGRAIDLEPRYADALYGLAVTLIREGRRLDARDALIRCIEADPAHIKARRKLVEMRASGWEAGEGGWNILLSYGFTPATTGAYFWRNLMRKHRVLTFGNIRREKMLETWSRDDFYRLADPPDIPVSPETSAGEVMRLLPEGFVPDLFLWVESSLSVPNFPRGISGLPCPKACYLIDSHTKLEWHVRWAPQFDYVFVAQRAYLEAFRKAGCRKVTWLPLGCDPEIHRKTVTSKKWDVGFVGNVWESAPIYDRRRKLLERLASAFDLHTEKAYLDDMARSYSETRIVFNCAAKDDLNMRVFEALSCGSLLLTDEAPGSGLLEFFRDGEHLAVYNDDTLEEKVRFYLDHPRKRESVARKGMKEVSEKHTYEKRLETLLNIVREGEERKRGSRPRSVCSAVRRIRLVYPNWVSNPANVGDSVCTTAVCRALKDRYPGSRMTLVTNGFIRDALVTNPDIDEIVLPDEAMARIPAAEWIRSANERPPAHSGYDLNLVVWPDWHPRLWEFLRGNGFERMNRMIRDPLSNIITTNLCLRAGLEDAPDKRPRLCLTEEDRAFAAEQTGPGTAETDAIAIAVAAKRRSQIREGESVLRYPEKHWRTFTGLVKEGYRNRTGRELEVWEIGHHESVHIGDRFLGHRPLRQVAAVIDRMKLIVASDGGMHNIANALGKKVLLFQAYEYNPPELYRMGNGEIGGWYHLPCRFSCHVFSTIRQVPDRSKSCGRQCRDLSPEALASHCLEILFRGNA